MNTISNSELVPYYRGLQPLVPLKPAAPHPVLADGDPASKRYAHIPPRLSRYENQPQSFNSEYNSNRRLKTSKLNQVGLLIDIHA